MRPFFNRPGQAAWGRAFALLIVCVVTGLLGCSRSGPSEFSRLMNTGKNYLDRGEAARAIPLFEQAVAKNPGHPDAHLNLANAFLVAGNTNASLNEKALEHARQALGLEPNSAAALYVAGCANLRLRRFEEALKDLQVVRDMDPSIGAVTFQLGRAHQEMGHWEDAIAAFGELIQFEPEHSAAYYALSQAQIRAGKREEAEQSLQQHQKVLQALKDKGVAPGSPSDYERCKYTEARAPFEIEQPDARGISVSFADVSAGAFAGKADAYTGPVGVVDYNHDGRNSLFVREGTNGFRLLNNSNGIFAPLGAPLPVPPEHTFARCLVGDLQNDRFEDVLMLGAQGSRLFRFATNGQATDTSIFSKINEVRAVDGCLVDLDFSGKLDLITVRPQGEGVQVLRNLGNLYFRDITSTSGIPATLASIKQIAMDDLNNDDLLDLVVASAGKAVVPLYKLRGGPLAVTNSPPDWPTGDAIATGDLNNDQRTDLVVVSPSALICVFNGLKERTQLPLGNDPLEQVMLVDYDNDGWLDILGLGRGLRLWRNLGQAGFREVTGPAGLNRLPRDRVESVALADCDNDGDTDLIVSVASQGLRVLSNQGGSANQQLKLRLHGNKSNASGLGIRVEVAAGGLRLSRTVNHLPVEIGLGKHDLVNSLTVRWFDLALSSVDVKVDPKSPLRLDELQLPTGSCPYLYAWDGEKFRFVTDILGASPLGLPAAEGKLIEADPHELVWLGDDSRFVPQGSDYVLQVTEELREVLYLDEAKLVVVDHPEGTEVHPSTKLLPGKPFPPAELIDLHRKVPLRQAVRNDGLDVTSVLAEYDGSLVSPIRLRSPQLRGLAEPYSVTLDFGPLDTDRPLALVLTGWLRFGGGMVNVGASHNPDLPFPFPVLEAELGDGSWKPIDARVGAPVGKTKTIVADLHRLLPAGSKRLRLSTAFEIHWDRIALMERAAEPLSARAWLDPHASDLHWHGYGEYENLPWYLPLTPSHSRVRHDPPWRILPTGWCTRYGQVNELVLKRDDALVLINGGDELTLRFRADALKPKPAGLRRDFFLYTVGWEKDSDFHVVLGDQVDPLPFHGMSDARYGTEARPSRLSDEWIRKYNTRWVAPLTFKRSASATPPKTR